jgi:transposase
MQLLPERLFTNLPTYTCLLNLTLLPLPTGSPELNPTKQVWEQLRHRGLANRRYDSYELIVGVSCDAWNAFTQIPGAIHSLCRCNRASLDVNGGML